MMNIYAALDALARVEGKNRAEKNGDVDLEMLHEEADQVLVQFMIDLGGDAAVLAMAYVEMTPDGHSLVFTSDRGGSPQIYRVSASGGEPQRVTFEGKYNARASFSPDGKRLTMVTRDGGEFRIGVLDLATKTFRTVSDGNLDESPSFAPNGSMIIYAARAQGRGALFAVSADGRTRQRLALDVGERPRARVVSLFQALEDC